MRIWHKELISVLPDRLLLTLWRELTEQVNMPERLDMPLQATKFPIEHWNSYIGLVTDEMIVRGLFYHWRGLPCNPYAPTGFVERSFLFDTEEVHWHNRDLFWQDVNTLKCQYENGSISDTEWDKIKQLSQLHILSSGSL